MYVPEKIERILYTQEELAERVRQLGERLTSDYGGKNPLFVCVLKGSVVFFADLIRGVRCPLEIEFYKASSYDGTRSTGKVDSKSDVPDITGRDVVLVEDIVDTARTLSDVKARFLEKSPASLKIACLLDKRSCRDERFKNFSADYTGFEIENLFVVGYGLDCSQAFRNLPYIGVYK